MRAVTGPLTALRQETLRRWRTQILFLSTDPFTNCYREPARMRIRGLSNQWGDRLLEQFAPDPAGDRRCQARNEATQRLLHHLTTVDGPDLWVGTSHSLLSFCATDIRHECDTVPPLAYVEVSVSSCRISYPTPSEFCALPDTHITCSAASVEEAGHMLLVAIANSDSNPDWPSAQWNWFVCPRCDFHSIEYGRVCFRCDWEFPSERKAMAVGLYRRPRLPAGAVCLSRATAGSVDM